MLRVLRLILLMGILPFLYSCEGLREYKWVENNTLYSSRAPGIEIQVKETLQEGTDASMNAIVDGSSGAISSTTIRRDNYMFWDKEGTQQLVIQVDNLNDVKWHMGLLRFSSNPAFFDVSKERIGEWIFDTGIYVNAMPQQSFLVKIFGRNFGNRTRLFIQYMEGVDSSWNTSDLALSNEKKAFLEAFGKRAGESFTVSPYSGFKHPDQRSDVIVTKQ